MTCYAKGILCAQWVRLYKDHLCHKTTTNKKTLQYYMSLKLWEILMQTSQLNTKSLYLYYKSGSARPLTLCKGQIHVHF